MEIKEHSYLHDILLKSGNDSDKITITVADLKSFQEDVAYNARFAAHPYYITIDEACKFLNVKRCTLYNWLRSGRIHGKKFGRKWQVREIDIL